MRISDWSSDVCSSDLSVVQVADCGLARIGDVLQRMKALAAQSLSGVPTYTERGFIDAEYQELVSEITAIADTTRFNGQSLLNGSAATADYFVGTDVSDTITVDFQALATGYSAFGAVTLSVNLPVAKAAGASAAMSAFDAAVNATPELGKADGRE